MTNRDQRFHFEYQPSGRFDPLLRMSRESGATTIFCVEDDITSYFSPDNGEFLGCIHTTPPPALRVMGERG